MRYSEYTARQSHPHTGCRTTKQQTMSLQLQTLLNYRYEVRCPQACTVTDSSDALIISVSPGIPAYFIADGHPVTLSADSATMLPANGRKIEVENGNNATGLSATGEPVVALDSSSFRIVHAMWFDNANQPAISIAPAEWKNEVMTCYLKTTVPVVLSGVQWLYGEPAMVQGFTYVVALQQIDASTVLANLAYTLKQ